jgi:hypothetical protein
MVSRVRIVTLFLGAVISTIVGQAQPGYQLHNPASRIFDIVFPVDVPVSQQPYFLKMVLRYEGSDYMQFVVVIYSDDDKYWVRRCEITEYVLDDKSKAKLPQLLSKLSSDSPDEAVRATAAELKVAVSRFTVAPEAVYKILADLKSIKVSPAINTRTGLDSISEYQFWYDTWEESDYYSIMGPSGNATQDALSRWMIGFKANFPDFLKEASASETVKR